MRLPGRLSDAEMRIRLKEWMLLGEICTCGVEEGLTIQLSRVLTPECNFISFTTRKPKHTIKYTRKVPGFWERALKP